MEMLNIKHGNQVQQLRYDYDSGVFSFEKDIQIGDWVVSRFIKIGGPKDGSIYKYDFKNYFEFVITDGNGMCQVLTWNHNAGDKALCAYWGDSAVDALPYFFANHPVFSAKDWEEYKYVLAIKCIGESLENMNRSAKDKIDAIASIIKEMQ